MIALKTCSRCAETKDLSGFYANKLASDRKQSHCKECDKAAKRLWEHNHRDIVNARRKRRRERIGTILDRQTSARYQKANMDKLRAQQAVKDYSQQLVVVWLCAGCHKKRHAELTAGSVEKSSEAAPCEPKGSQ